MSVDTVLDRSGNVRDIEQVFSPELPPFHPDEVSPAFWDRLRTEMEFESHLIFKSNFTKGARALALLGKGELLTQAQKQILSTNVGDSGLITLKLIDQYAQIPETVTTNALKQKDNLKGAYFILANAENLAILGHEVKFTTEQESEMKNHWELMKLNQSESFWFASLMKRMGIDPEIDRYDLDKLREQIFNFNTDSLGDPKFASNRRSINIAHKILDLYILSSQYAGFENGKFVVRNGLQVRIPDSIPDIERFDA